jgi:hypothetical protein
MKQHVFVFNGDADGLCALQQLSLAAPGSSQLITGVKRDQALLERVDPASTASITVLDLPLPNNRTAVEALIAAGKTITYFDHHLPGDILRHPNFVSHIDTRSDVCTSLIVDREIAGEAHEWAIVGAFGDSLDPVAVALAQRAGLDGAATQSLAELGRYLNYNSYGETIADLHYSPIALHRRMLNHTRPSNFIIEDDVFANLAAAYREDLVAARNVDCEIRAGGLVFFLPDKPWARRVVGAFANSISQQYPGQAIAIVAATNAQHYAVNVRVPHVSTTTAGAFCGRFTSGGGRALAGGINRLPNSDLGAFLQEFDQAFGVDHQRCKVA